jgi:hypothetical protein
MKTWMIINRKRQIIAVKVPEKSDLPIAFSVDRDDPSDVIRAIDIDNVPVITDETEEITIRKEDMIGIEGGVYVAHRLGKPVKVRIV